MSQEFTIAEPLLKTEAETTVQTPGAPENGKEGDHPESLIKAETVLPTIEPENSLRGEVSSASAISLEQLEQGIEILRNDLTRLVPAEEHLEELKRTRTFANYKRLAPRFFLFRILRRPLWLHDHTEAGDSLTRLAEIEEKISSNSSPAELRRARLQLKKLQAELRIKVGEVNSTFIGLIFSITTSKELVEDLVQKIGHRELQQEARMHLRVVSELVERLKQLKPEELAIEGTDDLTREIFGSVGVMVELEHRRSAVEELVYKDRKRRQWTVGIVIAYIAFVLALAIGVAVKGGGRFLMDAPLVSLRLPLIGIPWPVIVWSLIGSFAAMIYRFNKKPIYDFGDAVKWMLTRPVQGVVLGAAFYLVLISGLFLFGGRGAPDNPSSSTANDVILILSFLVGFSDRFADSVFKVIVDKYSQIHEPRQHGGDTSLEEPEADARSTGRRRNGKNQSAMLSRSRRA